jgi:hypothetical protein|nr:MAG TPA: hypothetical protein [Bacteriophage sp.]
MADNTVWGINKEDKRDKLIEKTDERVKKLVSGYKDYKKVISKVRELEKVEQLHVGGERLLGLEYQDGSMIHVDVTRRVLLNAVGVMFGVEKVYRTLRKLTVMETLDYVLRRDISTKASAMVVSCMEEEELKGFITAAKEYTKRTGNIEYEREKCVHVKGVYEKGLDVILETIHMEEGIVHTDNFLTYLKLMVRKNHKEYTYTENDVELYFELKGMLQKGYGYIWFDSKHKKGMYKWDGGKMEEIKGRAIEEANNRMQKRYKKNVLIPLDVVVEDYEKGIEKCLGKNVYDITLRDIYEWKNRKKYTTIEEIEQLIDGCVK